MFRGALVTAIYRKTTEISIVALDNSAAVTLMSTDVERIVQGCRQMHELWVNIIQVAFATWILERTLGVASVAPFGICLRMFINTRFTNRFCYPSLFAWDRIANKASIFHWGS
jgi:ATP-binding cassette subfamily C (CFTR/MRP) protein 1